MDDGRKWMFTQTPQTLEAFTEFLVSVFKSSHPEQQVEIVRGQGMTGLAIIQEGAAISPMVRIDTLYERYMEGCSLFKAYCEMESAYEDNCSQDNCLAGIATDYDFIRHRICYKLVGTERNRELLESSPHIPWLDLAVVFYIP